MSKEIFKKMRRLDRSAAGRDQRKNVCRDVEASGQNKYRSAIQEGLSLGIEKPCHQKNYPQVGHVPVEQLPPDESDFLALMLGAEINFTIFLLWHLGHCIFGFSIVMPIKSSNVFPHF